MRALLCTLSVRIFTWWAAKLIAGRFIAFKAIYECDVPVVAAVNGFCLGGGIGLVGNADVIVASDDATFGIPEIDRGAHLHAGRHSVADLDLPRPLDDGLGQLRGDARRE